MTTERAIELFREQVEIVYERYEDFDDIGNTELEIIENNECIDVEYDHVGEGKIENVVIYFVKKINGEWFICKNKEVDKDALELELRKALKSTYEMRLEQYNEEYAYEIAEA